MEYKEKTQIGTCILGEEVRISDPCYSLDVWCAGTLSNVLAGEFVCFLQQAVTGKDYYDMDDIRVAKIEVRHKDYLDINPTELTDIHVGVDSGQAGIFDLAYYKRYHSNTEINDAWYKQICELTAKYVENTQIVPFIKSKFYKPEFDIAIEIDSKGGLNETDRHIAVYKHKNNEPLSNAEQEFIDFRNQHLEAYMEVGLDYRVTLMRYKDSPQGSNKIEVLWGGITHDKGIVSSSGYGDGGYSCFVGKNPEGKIVSISIDFFFCEDEEE